MFFPTVYTKAFQFTITNAVFAQTIEAKFQPMRYFTSFEECFGFEFEPLSMVNECQNKRGI